MKVCSMRQKIKSFSPAAEASSGMKFELFFSELQLSYLKSCDFQEGNSCTDTDYLDT